LKNLRDWTSRKLASSRWLQVSIPFALGCALRRMDWLTSQLKPGSSHSYLVLDVPGRNRRSYTVVFWPDNLPSPQRPQVIQHMNLDSRSILQ